MRILAAMSGGVDSSVVAGLLHGAGHEVIGATLQLYDHGAAVGRKGACCAGQDIHDARRVADRLGIAHYVIDAEARFRSAVIDDFADNYASGTDAGAVRAVQSDGEVHRSVAALHRSRLRRDGDRALRAPGRWAEWRGIAPGGRFAARSELVSVRHHTGPTRPLDLPAGRHAGQGCGAGGGGSVWGWRLRRKPDSQDICFVPAGRYDTVLAGLRPDAMAPGDIVDVDGAVLGQHEGVGRYTVGQAKRLGTAGGAGQVVVALDAPSRRIVVGPRSSGTRHLHLREVNWLIDPPEDALRCAVKLRARDELRPASVMADGAVLLDEPALPAPGQACVFYLGDRVLGGGFIER